MSLADHRARHLGRIAEVRAGLHAEKVGYPIGVREAEVVRTVMVGAGLLRVTLGGKGTEGFEAHAPDEHVKLLLVVLGASVFGTMFLLPLYFQTGRGLTAWEAGLLLAPQGLGEAAGSVLVNRTIDKVTPRTLVVTGIVLILAGTVPFTQLGHGIPDAAIVAALAVRGLGMAMVGAPVMNIVYSRIEPEHLPRASGALNLLNTVGGSVGTAALAVVLQSRLSARGQDIGSAFGDTFWWVLGFCLLAAAGATRLPRTQARKP
ncbi:MFS transporter [Streptomyces sp. NPDC006978]|uniref:MFS transporter n=1 Tax=Streptomyces sp. NPDC006978 TaxID=3364769 RepID=UPI0036C1DF62